jgi:hypothetical protein
MLFEYGYLDGSQVANTVSHTNMNFSPDTHRDATFFKGVLAEGVFFREAISALHDVVVSDLRWKPKDRTVYKAWLARQEELDWTQIDNQRSEVAAQIADYQAQLDVLRKNNAVRMRPFYKARQRYFDYLYRRDHDSWFVLDPVITVHPDELFFECFSQDESTYGKLSTSYEAYKTVGEMAYGTTNVDYSQSLYEEFQKIRSYKTTKLEIDPAKGKPLQDKARSLVRRYRKKEVPQPKRQKRRSPSAARKSASKTKPDNADQDQKPWWKIW